MDELMEKDAHSIGEFCQRHGFSRASLYNLVASGKAPRLMRVGHRILISRESAAEWRRDCELASEGAPPLGRLKGRASAGAS
jgi:predicted DNA-binding transcriptional regulator AlpA